MSELNTGEGMEGKKYNVKRPISPTLAIISLSTPWLEGAQRLRVR
jgi:hypothetical protein